MHLFFLHHETRAMIIYCVCISNMNPSKSDRNSCVPLSCIQDMVYPFLFKLVNSDSNFQERGIKPAFKLISIAANEIERNKVNGGP